MLADNEELIEEIREKCSVFTTDLRIKIVRLLYERKSLYVQEMIDLLKVERQLIAHNLLKLKHHRIKQMEHGEAIRWLIHNWLNF